MKNAIARLFKYDELLTPIECGVLAGLSAMMLLGLCLPAERLGGALAGVLTRLSSLAG